MKRRIIIFIISAALFITVGIIYAKFRKENIEARNHVKNSTRIRIGMTINEVVEIMGEPDDRVVSFFDKNDSMLYYKPPFGASSGIYFEYDTDTRRINRIISYE